MALLLGKTVAELDMTWREFMYWQEYLALEPPDMPARQRTAALMAQITNMSGRALRDKKMVSAKDFLGLRESEQQSMQAQIDYMKSMEQ